MSPAAGILQERDLVLAVNDTNIREGKSGVQKINKMMADEDLIEKPTTFKISRGGVEQQVTITPKKSCAGRALAADSTSINAYADGQNVIVTTGMMNFAKQDSELALVIGHELAHNSRKHVEAKKKNAMLGMVLGAVVTGVTGVNVMGLGQGLGAGAFSQSFEYEADYVGLYHTARAGYDITDAPHFWRRMGAKHPAAIHLKGSTHPSSAKRFVALEETVAEINAKKASGAPLVPEEKSEEEFEAKARGVNE
jgi:predicted Zn-dependent protease